MNATVKDVMTTSVVWVERGTPFAEIAASLRQYRVSAFPVLDEAGEVIGVVSEADLLAKLALGNGEDGMPGMITGILRQHEVEKARAVTAGDLMTAPAATVSPDDTIEHAARLMYVRQVKRLPVLDEAGRLTGIVSRADVLAVYGRPDTEIGEEIRREVPRPESPAAPGTFHVAVTDGVVTLAGQPRTCAQGHDIIRRARHVQGVIAVRDRLDYPTPGPDSFEGETGRVGLAARASHDLTPEVTQWPARVTVPGSGDTSDPVTLSAELDLGSLTVRQGTGGATVVRDRRERARRPGEGAGHGVGGPDVDGGRG